MSGHTPYSIFHHLYSTVDGYYEAREATKKTGYYYSAHTYGEITYRSFFEAFSKVKPQPSDIYYDLGSGIGNTVMEAALIAPIAKSIGIEILPDLVEVSKQVKASYLREFPDHENHTDIEFHNINFKDADFSDGTIIFINSTLMTYEFDRHMFEKLESLKKGTRLINSSHELDIPSYSLFDSFLGHFSWDNDILYLYEKIS